MVQKYMSSKNSLNLELKRTYIIMIKNWAGAKFSQFDGTWTGNALSRASARSWGNIDTSSAAYL